MSLSTPDLTVEIAVSNMDLYPQDLPGRPSWGSNLEQLAPYLEATGCRNFEVHPTRAIVQDARDAISTGDTEIFDEMIGSLHQTFNSGEGLFGKIADRYGVQRSSESIAGMLAIQTALSRPVPSVHYPKQPFSRVPAHKLWLHPEYPGSFPVVQPSPEVLEDFSVTDNKNLLSSLSTYGYVGLCPDTVHDRKIETRDDGWAEQFRTGRVFQMHVGADRFDVGKHFPGLAETSREEFKAFMSRKWQNARDTELGDMITAAIENWVQPEELKKFGQPLLRQVIEIPPSPRAFFRRVAQHARFVENLAEVVRETGAKPLLWGDTAT